MEIKKESITYFGNLTHDLSPIHLDALYARRTQFGAPIAHGVSCVLVALGYWAKGRKFRLKKLEVDFRKPIYSDQKYTIQTHELSEGVNLRIENNGILCTNIKFSWIAHAISSSLASPPTQEAIQKLKLISVAAPTTESIMKESNEYSIDQSILENLSKYLDLEESQLPMYQLQALSWASWVVGMRRPAKEALFSKMIFNFSVPPDNFNAVSLQNLEVKEDPEYHHLEFTGTAIGIKEFSLSAFERIPPFSISLEAIQAAIPKSKKLEGKTTLITGGTRGFGAVLAKAFALQGSNIVLTALNDSSESKLVMEELSRLEIKSVFIKGDIKSSSTCKDIQNHLGKIKQNLDFLILNAFPFALSNDSMIADSKVNESYIQKAIPCIAQPLFHLSDFVKTGGVILNVSSSFVKKPDPKFLSYITAKIEAEALLRERAAKDQLRKYVNLRIPKIATDQTNAILSFEKLCSPEFVVKKMLTMEAIFDSNTGYVEVDLEKEV